MATVKGLLVDLPELVPQAEVSALEDRLVRESLDLAENLALVCRLLEYRDKGRAATKRGLDHWRRTRLPRESGRWFVEAVHLTKLLLDDRPSEPPPFRALEVQKTLIRLTKVMMDRKRGRRVQLKPGGLLCQTCNTKGRDESLPHARAKDEESRRTVRLIYGIKLRIYARQRGLPDEITVAGAMATLRRDAFTGNPQALTRWLDRCVPDSEAVATEAAQMRIPGTRAARAKRLQRAKKRFPFVLPNLVPESGGN